MSTRAVNTAISSLASTVAKPVDPERAKIPSCAAQVLPELHLDKKKAHEFCHQERLTLKPEPPGRPRRCHMCTEKAEVELRHRLLESQAALVWPLDEIAHTN